MCGDYGIGLSTGLDDDFRGKTNILWCANSFQIDLEGLQELKHFVKIL